MCARVANIQRIVFFKARKISRKQDAAPIACFFIQDGEQVCAGSPFKAGADKRIAV
jgi:hypothetical protein